MMDKPRAIPAAVKTRPVTATCAPPRPKIGRRNSHSRNGRSSSPITNSSRTTPNSAKCRMLSTSLMIPSSHGPMSTPAMRKPSTVPMPSFLNRGTVMTAAARNTTTSCTNDMLIRWAPCIQRAGMSMLPDHRANDKPASGMGVSHAGCVISPISRKGFQGGAPGDRRPPRNNSLQRPAARGRVPMA